MRYSTFPASVPVLGKTTMALYMTDDFDLLSKVKTLILLDEFLLSTA